MAVRIIRFIRFDLIQQMLRLRLPIALEIKPGQSHWQLNGPGILGDSLLQDLLSPAGSILTLVEARQIDIRLRVVRFDIDCSLETFLRRTVFRIEQLGETQI